MAKNNADAVDANLRRAIAEAGAIVIVESFGECAHTNCPTIGPVVLGNGYCVDTWDQRCGTEVPKLPVKAKGIVPIRVETVAKQRREVYTEGDLLKAPNIMRDPKKTIRRLCRRCKKPWWQRLGQPYPRWCQWCKNRDWDKEQ